MMSECAYFVKDVVGPRGAVTIENRTAAHSDDVDSHTGTSCLRIHHSELDNSGDFMFDDDIVDVSDAWHQELCEREQERFYRVIAEDQDMSTHWRQVRDSMRIVFAADESCRSGEVVHLATEQTLLPDAIKQVRHNFSIDDFVVLPRWGHANTFCNANGSFVFHADIGDDFWCLQGLEGVVQALCRAFRCIFILLNAGKPDERRINEDSQKFRDACQRFLNNWAEA